VVFGVWVGTPVVQSKQASGLQQGFQGVPGPIRWHRLSPLADVLASSGGTTNSTIEVTHDNDLSMLLEPVYVCLQRRVRFLNGSNSGEVAWGDVDKANVHRLCMLPAAAHFKPDAFRECCVSVGLDHRSQCSGHIEPYPTTCCVLPSLAYKSVTCKILNLASSLPSFCDAYYIKVETAHGI
jgi:hypothetical protein